MKNAEEQTMLNNSEMSKIQALLIEASNDQMQEIAAMFNDARNLKVQRAARSFTTGQKVKWTGRNGAMEGTIVKVLKKNVRVKVGSDMWNVTASLLQAA
jgi:sRNA-binding protein|tara:strand:- start:471 stop:767 length:297 start_codon:yes stop_codon:yes gene_type:complete